MGHPLEYRCGNPRRRSVTLPLRCTDDLVVRDLADETIVYDRKRNKAHCLNRTSAWVWRHCDGKSTIAELAQQLHAELGLPRSDEVVRLALDQLARRNLVELPVTPPEAAGRRSRRDVLKELALAAAALPLVMTMTSRTARATIMSFDDECSHHFAKGGMLPKNEGKDCNNGKGKCSGGFCSPKSLLPDQTTTTTKPLVNQTTTTTFPPCGGICSPPGQKGDCPNGCTCVGGGGPMPLEPACPHPHENA